MIISHKYKFIFFCTPKTGSTSLQSQLEMLNEEKWSFTAKGMFDAKHIPPAYVKAIMPQAMWEDYFKFSFVRNPYDWFVSQFKYNYPEARFRLNYLIRFPWRAKSYLKTYRYYKHHSAKSTYSEKDVTMLHDFLKNCRGIPSHSSLEQNIYAYNSDGKDLVDFVGRFESLDEDVSRIQNRIGVNFELPHLNKTKRSSFRDYLNNDAMRKIEELWEQDFTLLNYAKESS